MWTFITGLFSVVLVDLVLSGDNALVIGMACAGLPEAQRRKGILLGSLAAVFMRVLLAAGAAVLMQVPLLRAAGGVMLVWIAYKLAAAPDAGHGDVRQGATVWDAVKTIAIADLVMSLDNVLAVGGISRGNLFLLLFGLGLTIPIIMWGSSLVAGLMQRAPWLGYLGAAVLAWTAGAMITEDPWLKTPPGAIVPLMSTALVLTTAVFTKVRQS